MGKLVRDKVPEITVIEGQKGKVRTLSPSEFRRELLLKLQEEISHYVTDQTAGKLTDVLEVIVTLADLVHDLSPDDLEEMRRQYSRERGGFFLRHYLEA